MQVLREKIRACDAVLIATPEYDYAIPGIPTGGMRPALVHEERPLWVHRRGHHHPPGRPLELVALCGDSSPFFLVGPMRAMARHMVERLTESPVTVSI